MKHKRTAVGSRSYKGGDIQMSKRIIAGLVIITVILGNIGAVNAAEPPYEVRVGLETKFKEQASISIGNKGLAVGYEVNQTFMVSGVIYASSSFSAVPSNAYYVKLETNYPSYEAANQAAAYYINFGITAVPCLIAANTWVVYLGGFSTEGEAMNASYSTGESAAIVSPNGRTVVLTDGGTAVALFDNSYSFAQFKDADNGTVSLGDRRYRGRIELGRYAGRNITAVNVVPLEQYLYSVVPAEMLQSFNLEALKAQAIAARTYAVTKLGAHSADGYELCDTTSCQLYIGATNEADTTTFAVDATGGILIYYNGSPIEAFFFASSGGYTENSENVWSATLPYLRSVPEINETTAKQWTRSFTFAEITQLLADNGVSIGNATSISIGSVSSAGRVKELIISGTSGEKILKKEEIRTFFSKSADGSLSSRMFTLSNGTVGTTPTEIYVTNGVSTTKVQLSQIKIINSSGLIVSVADIGNTMTVIGSNGGTATYSLSQTTVVSGAGQTDTITFVGSGNGHGVGMSQYGANGMAAMGYTYEQILKHYYTGVEVR